MWNPPAGHEIRLQSNLYPGYIVMDFVRFGMQEAAPRFRVDGFMERADKFARQRNQHHIGFDLDINHPDAKGLAHSWQDVDDLLADREALLQRIERLEKEIIPAALRDAIADMDDVEGFSDVESEEWAYFKRCLMARIEHALKRDAALSIREASTDAPRG
jgi:hypothetical protein